VLDQINETMFKEKGDEWIKLEQWHLHPKTGRIMFKNFKIVKYHHSIADKIEKKLHTPAVKQFKEKFNI
jgi:hypothetical protein